MAEYREASNDVGDAPSSRPGDVDGSSARPDDAPDGLPPRCLHRLIDLAKRHVYEKYATRSTANDLVYSVYRSVYRHTRRRAAEHWDSTGFWRWLATGSLRGEFEALPSPGGDARQPARGGQRKDHAVQDRNMPTTTEVIELAGAIETLVACLGPIDQQIFLLRVEGFSADEIGSQVMRDASAIHHRLRLIRDRIGTALGARVPSQFE